MIQCYSSGDFKKYFNENMQELGLPVPSTLFDSYNVAIAHAVVMAEALRSLGKGATVAELIGATTGLEKLKVAAAFGASAYIGAVIGSIAVASGRSLGCGSRISDLFGFIHQNKLHFKGFNAFYANNPQVLNKSHTSRKSFGMRAKNSPVNFEHA